MEIVAGQHKRAKRIGAHALHAHMSSSCVGFVLVYLYLLKLTRLPAAAQLNSTAHTENCPETEFVYSFNLFSIALFLKEVMGKILSHHAVSHLHQTMYRMGNFLRLHTLYILYVCHWT